MANLGNMVITVEIRNVAELNTLVESIEDIYDMVPEWNQYEASTAMENIQTAIMALIRTDSKRLGD